MKNHNFNKDSSPIPNSSKNEKESPKQKHRMNPTRVSNVSNGWEFNIRENRLLMGMNVRKKSNGN